MNDTPLTSASARLSEREIERLKTAAALLRKAERPVWILRAVTWGPEVEPRFFESGGRELPQVSYQPLDAGQLRANNTPI